VKEDGLRRVYLQERRFNTNKNLARATTKSKSETQTVSNGCVGPMTVKIDEFKSVPTSETSSSE